MSDDYYKDENVITVKDLLERKEGLEMTGAMFRRMYMGDWSKKAEEEETDLTDDEGFRRNANR